MIIVAADQNNYNLVLDSLQAKLLVEVLRELQKGSSFVPVVIAASQQVNRDGFETTGNDAIAATTAVVSVLGYWTKQLKKNPPEVTSEVVPPTTAPEEGFEEKQEVPKPLVN